MLHDHMAEVALKGHQCAAMERDEVLAATSIGRERSKGLDNVYGPALASGMPLCSALTRAGRDFKVTGHCIETGI